MSNNTVHFISVDLIDPMKPNRKADPELVQRIAQSLIDNEHLFYEGLMQPVGVKVTGDRFQQIFGNNRLQAAIFAKRKTIAAYVLSDDCSPDQELAFSLQENHLRAEEDMESTLARVQTYASYKRCSIAEAAKACGVNKSYVSKARKISDQLGPEAKALAKKHKVGLSLLYLIAPAKPQERQLELLNAYIDGQMDRDAIARAVKTKSTNKRNKSVSLNLTMDDITVKFVLPASVTYDQLAAILGSLKGKFNTHRKNGIPVKLLPEVMVGADA